MAVWNVSNASELHNALGSASGGDTILLASGNYGDVNLSNISFSENVTIKSADGNGGATFSRLELRNADHLTIDNVTLSRIINDNHWNGILHIDNDSHHIEFVNSEIIGPELVTGGDGNGALIRGDYITFANNYIHNVHMGAHFAGVEHFLISGNKFDYIQSDSMKLNDAYHGIVENNIGARHIHPDQPDHVDFIQFQNDSADVIVRGNILLPDHVGQVYQGIFLKDGYYEDIIIEQNLIYTNTVNGIYVRTASDVTVRNNIVLTPPDSTKWGTADIKVVDPLGPIIVENNITNRITGTDGSNNIIAQFTDPNSPNYYNNLFANAMQGTGATIEDFLPIAGSLADYNSGFGAGELLYAIFNGELGTSTFPTYTPPEPPDPSTINPETDLDILLVDAESGNVLADLQPGSPINVDLSNTDGINILFEVPSGSPLNGFVGSVVFDLNNGQVIEMQEAAPYALFGDSLAGLNSAQLEAGQFTVNVDVYTGPNATGTLVSSVATNFNATTPTGGLPQTEPPVEEPTDPPVEEPTDPEPDPLVINNDTDLLILVVDTETGDILAELKQGDPVDLNLFDNPNTNVVFEVPPGSPLEGRVGCVQFDLNGGELVEMQQFAPYALFGDAPDGLIPGSFADGSFTLDVSVFEGNEATGLTPLTTVNTAFNVTNQAETTPPETEPPVTEPPEEEDPNNNPPVEEEDPVVVQPPEPVEIDPAKDLALYLVNSETGAVLTQLEPGQPIKIDLSDQKGVNVVFEVPAGSPLEGNVGSVVFDLNGGQLVEVQQFPPYALFGDAPDGLIAGQFADGDFKLDVSVFAGEPGVDAAPLTSVATSFTVGAPQVPPPPPPERPDIILSTDEVYDFDGTTNSARILDHSDDLLLTDGTLELAFNVNALSNHHHNFLFSKDSRSFDEGGHFGVYIQDDNLIVRLQSINQNFYLRASDAIEPGKDYHTAVSFGAEGMKLYLNGQLVDQNDYTGGLLDNREPVVIGANQWISGDLVADNLLDPLDGTISKVALYDGQLTPSEIAEKTISLPPQPEIEPPVEVVPPVEIGAPIEIEPQPELVAEVEPESDSFVFAPTPAEGTEQTTNTVIAQQNAEATADSITFAPAETTPEIAVEKIINELVEQNLAQVVSPGPETKPEPQPGPVTQPFDEDAALTEIARAVFDSDDFRAL